MGKEGFSDSEEYNSNSSECSSREESYESNQDLTTLDSKSRELSSVSLDERNEIKKDKLQV